MNLLTSKYRITYEAFSKLSGSISKAFDTKELVSVTSKNLKYLIDSRLLRISILMNDDSYSFTFSSNGGSNIESNKLYDFETRLLDEKVPIINSDIPQELDQYIDLNSLTNPLHWGWLFERANIKICVSILSDDKKLFTKTDINILHLLVDSFTTKFQQLHLSNLLLEKNKNLENALKLIAEKNKEIEKILEYQQDIISNKTKEVKLKNSELLEISKINAHDLREPLTRILGLIEISQFYKPEQLNDAIFVHLKTSAMDLDLVLKQVVKVSTSSINAPLKT